jgi:hypothetical protein
MIVQHGPAQFAAQPRLIFGAHAFGVVQAADRDVDFVREVVGLEGELGAALGAERARPSARRLEAGRFAGREAKLGAFEAEPRHRCGTGGAATDRAVAARLVEWCAGGLVADLAAEAAALVSRAHCSSLVGIMSRTGSRRRGCLSYPRSVLTDALCLSNGTRCFAGLHRAAPPALYSDGCRLQHGLGYSGLPGRRGRLEAGATCAVSGLHGRGGDSQTVLGAQPRGLAALSPRATQ